MYNYKGARKHYRNTPTLLYLVGVVKLFNNINSNEDKYLGYHFPLQMSGYYFEASIL